VRSSLLAASRRMAARTALNTILRGSPRGSHLWMTVPLLKIAFIPGALCGDRADQVGITRAG
jgi:hypothetical protein